jgi:hypothetical protein
VHNPRDPKYGACFCLSARGGRQTYTRMIGVWRLDRERNEISFILKQAKRWSQAYQMHLKVKKNQLISPIAIIIHKLRTNSTPASIDNGPIISSTNSSDYSLNSFQMYHVRGQHTLVCYNGAVLERCIQTTCVTRLNKTQQVWLACAIAKAKLVST